MFKLVLGGRSSVLGSCECDAGQICVTGKDTERCTPSMSLTAFKVPVSISNITAEYNLVKETTCFLKACRN